MGPVTGVHRGAARAARPSGRLFAVLAGPFQYPCVRAALERRGTRPRCPSGRENTPSAVSLKTDERRRAARVRGRCGAATLNRFRRNYELITKHGLARNLRATDDDVDIDGVMTQREFSARRAASVRGVLASRGAAARAAAARSRAQIWLDRTRRARALRRAADASRARLAGRRTRPPRRLEAPAARGGASGARRRRAAEPPLLQIPPNGMRSSLRGLASRARGARGGDGARRADGASAAHAAARRARARAAVARGARRARGTPAGGGAARRRDGGAGLRSPSLAARRAARRSPISCSTLASNISPSATGSSPVLLSGIRPPMSTRRRRWIGITGCCAFRSGPSRPSRARAFAASRPDT